MSTPLPAPPIVPQEYFPGGSSDSFQKKNLMLARLKKFWQAFQFYARKIWPYINRLLTFLTYEIIKAVKGVVKIGLQQVGMFKE